MMKWKNSLTAEQAALMAAGYENVNSFDDIKIPMPDWMHGEGRFSSEDWETGYAQEVLDEENRQLQKYDTAKDIYQALLEEIVLADPWREDYDSSMSCLDIALRGQVGELDTNIVCEKSTLTKRSLAIWFWQHDHDIARRFWPSITEEVACMPFTKALDVEVPLSPKTKNTYLKTISALSAALIDGLTGKPNPDADAVLAALAAKGVEAPLKARTLSDYLKEAQQLD